MPTAIEPGSAWPHATAPRHQPVRIIWSVWLSTPLDYAGNLRDDGRMKSPTELRDRYLALGADAADRIACYCGSGVTAAHDIFALYLAGRTNALLYEGSWSDWSSDPTRPIATGPEDIAAER